MYLGDVEGVGRVPVLDSSLRGKVLPVAVVLTGHQGKNGRASEKVASVARANRVLCTGVIVLDDVKSSERWMRQLDLLSILFFC